MVGVAGGLCNGGIERLPRRRPEVRKLLNGRPRLARWNTNRMTLPVFLTTDVKDSKALLDQLDA